MWNSNRWLSVIRKDKPQFFLSSFPTHFYSYSCDVPTSKFGISIRRTEFFTGFLKFLRWAVCVGEISSRVYFDELFRALCQGGELIFQRVKGIFKFEMWFIDRRESVSLCLPGCSSLLSWNSMFFDKDIPLSMIPDFLFHVLYSSTLLFVIRALWIKIGILEKNLFRLKNSEISRKWILILKK